MIRPIALFDIDNTIYDGFSYFELLKSQASEGLISKQVVEDALTCMQKYTSGLQDYETVIAELIDIYAVGLKGKKYGEVLESTKTFFQSSNKFFPYVRPTIAKLKGTHEIALVTGEPQFVAEAVAEVLGLQSYCSSKYEVINGKLTGGVDEYLATRHEKHKAIQHLMRRHSTKKSFAFGDSEGDVEMLRAVEYPICLNCTDGLREIAKKEHWLMPKINEVTVLVEVLCDVGN